MNDEPIDQYDVIFVTKNTRAKSRGAKKAEKGKKYLVTSWYKSIHGTVKIFCIDHSLESFVTTSSCAKTIFNIYKTGSSEIKSEISLWQKSLIDWKTKTYVPVMLMHYYSWEGNPITTTKNGESVLVGRPLQESSEKAFWLNKKHVHDEDVIFLNRSSFKQDKRLKGRMSEVFSVRIPSWLESKLNI